MQRSIELYASLMHCSTVEDWHKQFLKLGKELGYEQSLLALFPDRHTPIEVDHAFLHTNYSAAWLKKYDANKLGQVDPTVGHCVNKSTPLIWSPEIFAARNQKEMYEEACGHGLQSGVTLPIHGARGELGVLCFVSDTKPDRSFHEYAHHSIPELSCFRDFILESALRFMKRTDQTMPASTLTPRELECLKWSAAGKSSWEIGQILRCSEATVNFHFSNLRRKFNTTCRRQAVVKAVSMGLI